MAQWKRTRLTMQEMQVQALAPEDPLEKEMATHSSILAWRIPWTEKGYSPWGRKDSDMTKRLNNKRTKYPMMENGQEGKNNTRKQLMFVASLKRKLLSKTNNNDLNRQSRQK